MVQGRVLKRDAEKNVRNELKLLVESGLTKRKYLDGRYHAYRESGKSPALAAVLTSRDFTSPSQRDIFVELCERIKEWCSSPIDLQIIDTIITQPRKRLQYGK